MANYHGDPNSIKPSEQKMRTRIVDNKIYLQKNGGSQGLRKPLLTATRQQTVQKIAHAVQQLIEQELAEQAAHSGDQVDRRNNGCQCAPVRIVEHALRGRHQRIQPIIVVIVDGSRELRADGRRVQPLQQCKRHQLDNSANFGSRRCPKKCMRIYT